MIQGNKYLVNTDRMYVMPDGEEYRAFWGSCEFIPVERMAGIRPTTRETNWYVKMNNVFIAGCDIHCWIETDKPPVIKHTPKWSTATGGTFMAINIYYTDDTPSTL